jgi:hypothetical protein
MPTKTDLRFSAFALLVFVFPLCFHLFIFFGLLFVSWDQIAQGIWTCGCIRHYNVMLSYLSFEESEAIGLHCRWWVIESSLGVDCWNVPLFMNV